MGDGCGDLKWYREAPESVSTPLRLYKFEMINEVWKNLGLALSYYRRAN